MQYSCSDYFGMLHLDIPGVSMNFLEKREVLKEASSEAVELAGKKMVQ